MSRWFLRAYAALLFLYPQRFRKRWGDDMRRDAERLLLEEHEATGRWPWRSGNRVLADLLTSLPREHLAARRYRSPHPVHDRRDTMGSFLLDLRHTLRGLRKSPGYTAIVLLVLAVGIGANSAIFSLVRGVVLRPLPFDDAQELVWMTEAIPAAGIPLFPFSAPDLRDLEERTSTLRDVGSFQSRMYELSGSGDPGSIYGVRTSASLFPMLGLEPALGRNFTAEEDRPRAGVVILSYALWQQRYGGAADVLGQTVLLDRRPHTVIGVMPASGAFPLNKMPLHGRPADLFLPMGFTEIELNARGNMHNLGVIARLAEGAGLDAAKAETTRIAGEIQELYGEVPSGMELQINVDPLREVVLGDVRRPLLLLLGAMGLVLLLVCANVASLTLSRSFARRAELDLRVALGAARARIVQLQLLESGLLAAVAGALGVALGALGLRAGLALLPGAVPFVERASLDGPVVAFSVALIALAITSSSLLPILSAAPLGSRQSSGARTIGSRGQRRMQRGMVVFTVSLAVVLLVGTGLLVQSLQRLVLEDRGYDADSVLAMELALPASAYPEPERVLGFVRQLHEEMNALPGVRSATVTTGLPAEATERRGFVADAPLDADARIAVITTWASPGLFDTLGIEIERGRAFTAADGSDGAGVVIVSQELARQTWGTDEVLGKRLRWGDRDQEWSQIVGVVGEVLDGPVGTPTTPHLYIPYDQFEADDLARAAELGNAWGRGFRIALAAEQGDPTALIGSALAAIGRLDSSLAVSRVETLSRRVGASLAPRRFSLGLLSGFSVVALLIAAMGLYGVLAYQVAQRKREIGVRLALGAERQDITRRIVVEGLKIAAWGLVLGLLGAVGLGRLMTAVLYETSSRDLQTLTVASAVLLGVALLASWIPAYRAGRLDPAETLKPE
ncbi:MAG: ABC transporter permease [Acidobacteriota bacterium]